MKKIAIAGVLLALTGCVQVDNYQDVIKHPVPAHLAGYWQSKGPQSKMVSPEAIATLVVTEEGDTLDCRQWQRVFKEQLEQSMPLLLILLRHVVGLSLL